jgi:hypothetical protein
LVRRRPLEEQEPVITTVAHGVAGVGDRALAPAGATGGCTGGAARIAHELARVLESGQASECSDAGDGPRERNAAPGLQCLDDGIQAPALDVVLGCGLAALEAGAVFGDGSDLCLEDHLRGRRRTDDLTEPTPVRGPPIGPAWITDILAPETGLQPGLGGLESPDGIRTGQSADGLVRHRGDSDRGASPGAPQPGELPGVTSIGVAAVAGLLGDRGGGHAPAAKRLLGTIALAPASTGAGRIDAEPKRGLGPERADHGIDITLPGAEGAQRDDLGTQLVRGIGHGHGVLVDSQPHIACAGVLHG